MREIKFRGRAVTYTKELDDAWVYGSLIVNGNCPYIVGGSTEVNYDAEYYTLDHDRWAEVLPESVGQYTGLKDKNGREIYEGDIVKAASQGAHAKCAVKWGQGRAGFFLHAPGICWNLSGGGENYDQETVEVIGNIHDNPELLEVPSC